MIARLGRANRHPVHWTYNIQISVGLLPRNSGKLNLISFNCATHFIGTRPYDPENLPPSQTLNEVWGKIMGNNPWTRTGACHTCRWKNKRNRTEPQGEEGGKFPINLWEPSDDRAEYWMTKLHTGCWYDSVIRQPEDTGNTNLVLRIILGYNVIIPACKT